MKAEDYYERPKLFEVLKPPYFCHFCGKEVKDTGDLSKEALIFHSLDRDHQNWNLENKAPVHRGCHSRYHGRMASTETREKRVRSLKETNKRDAEQGNFRRPPGRYWDSNKRKWIGKLQKSRI